MMNVPLNKDSIVDDKYDNGFERLTVNKHRHMLAYATLKTGSPMA